MMDYNNYYPAPTQPGHPPPHQALPPPPPPPSMQNQHHHHQQQQHHHHHHPHPHQPGGPYSAGPPMQQLMPPSGPPPPHLQMMSHSSPGPPPMGPGPPPPGQPGTPIMRQVVTPGAQPTMQQLPPGGGPPPLPPQHMLGPGPNGGPSPHHMAGPPPPGPSNYHQIPPMHPGCNPNMLPMAVSPHLNQQQQQQQPNLNNMQQPPRPSTGPSPQQSSTPHLVHQQSPHYVSAGSVGPPQMHTPQPGPPPPGMSPAINSQQPLNHMVSIGSQPHHMPPGPPMHHGLHPPPPHHQTHQFVNHGPPPMQHPSPMQGGYSQQPSQIQSPIPMPINHQPPGPPPPHLVGGSPVHHPNRQPPGGQPGGPPPQSFLPHNHSHPLADRGTFYPQTIPQAEFRIIELNKRLQHRPKTRLPVSPLPLVGSSEESYWWERFASDFFDDDSTLTLRISADDRPVEYSIGRTLIPRFFRSYFEGGVVDLSIKLRNSKETTHPHMIALECDQTDITTKNVFKYTANSMMNVIVHTEGHLFLEFVNNSYDQLVIKSWRFYTTSCHEYIDRSMTSTGLHNALFVEPVTRHGLTKSTISYLKMCMIMEPMQELMFHHKQTNRNARLCLKQLLFDKYNLKSVDDNRAPQPRRRKRKQPATTGATTKKTKANANNPNSMNMNSGNSNNIGFNNINNSLMSPSSVGVGGTPGLTLASQDVMVVGEPSMLGTDFGDENERRITRLENNQFDNSANTNSNSIIQTSPIQQNNINRMMQQGNRDMGNNNMQMTNHGVNNGANNNNNNHHNSDLNNSSNGGGCIPNNTNNNNAISNNNNHQMNLIPNMNGTSNHINHIVKSEMDLKQSNISTPTAAAEPGAQ